MRQLDFRVDVLRGGVPYSKLVFADPPSISCDATTDIALSLSGTYVNNPAVNYITDELAPRMIIDGVEHPLGVYRIVTRKTSRNAAGVEYDAIDAYDRAIALQWAKLESRDYWAAGTTYISIIEHYLTAAGLSRASITPSTATLQSAREDWDIGTQYLTIINALLSEINYDPIYFDLDGVAQLHPYAAPSVGNIAHSYGASDGVKVIAPGHERETDLYDKPNVFIAILSNPEYPTPLVKTAVNDNPGSKLSTISRGLRIPQVYKVDNIASETELQAYVDRLRDESRQSSETVQISTALEPGHSVGDTVALSLPELSGIFYESAWEMTLAAGQLMPHTLQRAVLV